MLGKLRRSYGERVLEKVLQKQKATNSVCFSDFKKCVIVLNENQLVKADLLKLMKLIVSDNAKTTFQFLSFKNKQKEGEGIDIPELKVLTQADLNWYFRPKSMSAAVCDLLVDLTNKPSIPLQFITAMSNAKCKIGVDQPWNKNVLNLMIQSKEQDNITDITEQLVKYMNMINTGKNAA